MKFLKSSIHFNMDNKKLKILCLDDVFEDAEIIREHLDAEGLNLSFDYVSDENDYTEKLKSERYDLILSDYNLPGFSGIAALMIAKKTCPDTPFICISGTIGEDLAVELMHIGASDYILKDKLNKLNISIQRSLKEAYERKSRLEAEALLKESEARFRDIVMSTYDWVWEIGSDWKYCYSSDNIENILGYSPQEIIGKSPFDLMPDTEKIKLEPLFLEIISKNGIIKDLENWNINKNGKKVCLLTNGFPIFDDSGALIGYRGTDKDITERKKLIDDLLEAKTRAEASDKLKTAFMNNISHEVRTPLNGILGFSEYVLQPELQQEEKESYLQILNESSERLVSTITNYMDISLIVSGNMSVKTNTINLELLLDNIYKKFEKKCIIKNLEFIKDFPYESNHTMKCDEVLLEKAVSHLLDNAVKFTQNGNITLGFSVTGNVYEIFIKDTGSGIDKDAQNKIFEVFRQEDLSITRGYEGSGLGLSIAKGIIELIGGKIRMESERGAGSAFYIDIPDEKEHEEKIKPIEQETNSDKIKELPVILITEDDLLSLSLLKVTLNKASLNFIIATNGKDAVDLCNRHAEISLVIMDIRMPVMDGLEATRRIKEFRKNLPVIGVTAYAMTGDKEKAIAAGFDDYITKPINPEILISVIRKLLSLK